MINKNNSSKKVWNFVSDPSLHPMKVTINVNEPGTADGLIFVAPYTLYGDTTVGQTGALIMGQDGNPVWFKPDDVYTQNRNFRVQCYFDYPVLTMWQGTISGTESEYPSLPVGDPLPGAYFQIINQNYEVIKKLFAQNGFTADVHEFIITKRNTALFTAVKQVPADLSPYGGPKYGFIDNYSIQEVDIETGKLLFFWDVLEHVNPIDSIVPISSSRDTNNIWDCFHVNSVEEGPNNTLLISMRNMWAIYNVNKKTGNIIWQLGGKQSDFTLGVNALFSWQHNARYKSGNGISLFNNACCASEYSLPKDSSHGLILKLDYENMTAEVDKKYYHYPLLYASHQGNLQELPNGNKFIGWGQEPYVSEFKSAGNTKENPYLSLIYDMEFPSPNFSYRAFKNKWVGYPLYPPNIKAEIFCKGVATVYVSWNGSTETTAWKVLAGSTPYILSTVVFSTPLIGFETDIKVPSAGPYFQVYALNAYREIIGISCVTCLHRD